MSYSVGTDTRLTNINTINPTNWVNGETALDAANMNSLTTAILSLKDEIYGGGPSTVDSIIDKLHKLRNVTSILGLDQQSIDSIEDLNNLSIISRLFTLENQVGRGFADTVTKLLADDAFISSIKSKFSNLDDGRAGIDTNKKTDYFEEIE